MQLKLINNEFSVCKVVDYSEINLNQEYVFTGSTEAFLTSHSLEFSQKFPVCWQQIKSVYLRFQLSIQTIS